MEYFFNFEKFGYLRGEHPEGCILCLIAAGSDEVIRLVVTETRDFIVALNLFPYNPGHLLVFPKRHVTDIRQLSEDEAAGFDRLNRRTLDCLDKTLAPVGYNIGFNMGRAAGASIDHLHLHIIPRFLGELGIADLLGGKRALVQDPRDTLDSLREAFQAP
ncbi:MAG: HIT domain-containing protein [Spirochaetota bacterium]